MRRSGLSIVNGTHNRMSTMPHSASIIAGCMRFASSLLMSSTIAVITEAITLASRNSLKISVMPSHPFCADVLYKLLQLVKIGVRNILFLQQPRDHVRH